MEEVTLILLVASLLAFAMSFKIQTRVMNVFVLVLSICGISAILQDATIADNQLYLAVFPLLAVAFFTIGNLVIIKEGE